VQARRRAVVVHRADLDSATTRPPSTNLSLLAALRPKQWTKNLLVFAGAVFALRLGDPPSVLAATGAFMAFCALSSAGYLINDLLDLEADRSHPIKRGRPIASGRVSERAALLLAVLLALAALVPATLLDPSFALVAGSYLVLTLLYSARLKHLVLIDLFVIAAGFVLRAVGGAVVVKAPVSPWLYVCTILVSLFLGLAKRRQELALLEQEADLHRRNLSEYTIGLLDQLLTIVTAAAIIAYSLYTFSAPNLPSNNAMMLTIPVVLYGLFRYLYLIHVRGLGGSPEELLLTDPPLLGTAVAWVLLSMAALYILR
jgi:4-hydroxybenzoate polyprenyltransferase